eukprot:SAG31_NODE_40346_length_281_cov_0.857143_1_plen_32_part_01
MLHLRRWAQIAYATADEFQHIHHHIYAIDVEH